MKFEKNGMIYEVEVTGFEKATVTIDGISYEADINIDKKALVFFNYVTIRGRKTNGMMPLPNDFETILKADEEKSEELRKQLKLEKENKKNELIKKFGNKTIQFTETRAGKVITNLETVKVLKAIGMGYELPGVGYILDEKFEGCTIDEVLNGKKVSDEKKAEKSRKETEKINTLIEKAKKENKMQLVETYNDDERIVEVYIDKNGNYKEVEI